VSEEFKTPYPDYDVLDKWDTPSWNEQTREVVDKRLNEVPKRAFLEENEWQIQAWRQGLAGIDGESQEHYGRPFAELDGGQQDEILTRLHKGEVTAEAWKELPPAKFFKQTLLKTVVGIYYSHPAAWSEIGYGGPASPRGYVRKGFDQRDPWEAKEQK
jgi:hypothetical protein